MDVPRITRIRLIQVSNCDALCHSSQYKLRQPLFHKGNMFSEFTTTIADYNEKLSQVSYSQLLSLFVLTPFFEKAPYTKLRKIALSVSEMSFSQIYPIFNTPFPGNNNLAPKQSGT